MGLLATSSRWMHPVHSWPSPSLAWPVRLLPSVDPSAGHAQRGHSCSVQASLDLLGCCSSLAPLWVGPGQHMSDNFNIFCAGLCWWLDALKNKESPHEAHGVLNLHATNEFSGLLEGGIAASLNLDDPLLLCPGQAGILAVPGGSCGLLHLPGRPASGRVWGLRVQSSRDAQPCSPGGRGGCSRPAACLAPCGCWPLPDLSRRPVQVQCKILRWSIMLQMSLQH